MFIHCQAESYFFDERFKIEYENVFHSSYGILNKKYNRKLSAIMDLKKIPNLFIRNI